MLDCVLCVHARKWDPSRMNEYLTSHLGEISKNSFGFSSCFLATVGR